MAKRAEPLSKERGALEESTRQALAGLGVTDENAMQQIISQAHGKPPLAAPPVQPISSPPAPRIPSPLPSEDSMTHELLEQVLDLPLTLLEPGPDQPRINVEPDSELLESIRVLGVKTPIHVRPSTQEGRYHIIAGERRWRACQLLGKATIPAIIRNESIQTSAAEALIDNLLRKDLTGYEEARGYQNLITRFGFQKSDLAQRLGCDKSRITRALQVLELPQHILDLTLGPQSHMTLTHVQELLPLRANLAKLQRVAKLAVDGGWTSNRIREEVTRVPRTNEGAQSVRFSAKGKDGPFTLIIKFHPNRINDLDLIEEKLIEVQERLQRIREHE